MATLRELAERTGYSPATISRILTGDPALAVSEEARKRVLEEAGRLNYAATKSRRGRSPKHLLRVAVAEMLTPAQQLRDPFYLYLRGYVEQACLDQKYAFLPLTPRGEGFVSPEGMAADGVVAIGRFTPAQAESLRSVSENVVFLNSSPDDARFDSVVLNYELGIRLALDHLLGLGHTRIGFIGPAWRLGDRKEPAPEVRRTWFLSLMEAHGLLDPELLVETPMDARSAADALRGWLADGGRLPTAFLTASEETAMGAIRALEEAGLSIPE
ncbi:MAG: LacI family DNA-binding transcriptional regulator, partial [Dysosmobacter welbionis]